MRSNGWYGWRPDTPDFRDRRYGLKHLEAPLPSSIDLRPQCPPVYDQGALGSCTGNAIAAAVEFDAIKQGRSAATPSRLFVYYNERVMEGTVDSDAGAEIRDGIKSVNALGAPPEAEWPYDPSKFAVKPPDAVYADARMQRALTYERLDSTQLLVLKNALAAGLPFVFGFSVYESFEGDQVASTGDVDLPAAGEAMVGGHAVLAVGYDDARARFLVRNSWGADWGQAGYFTMPYGYLINPGLADDFWVIQTVGQSQEAST